MGINKPFRAVRLDRSEAPRGHIPFGKEKERVVMVSERKGRGRGFASMDPNKQREIASKGGRAAHVQGTAHEWTSDEARSAGRKGGAASRRQVMMT
jgi:general stress protein YciG